MKIRLDEWLKREFYPPPAIRTARQTYPPRHGALHNIARLTLENGSSNIAIRNRLRAVFACEIPEVCCATDCATGCATSSHSGAGRRDNNHIERFSGDIP